MTATTPETALEKAPPRSLMRRLFRRGEGPDAPAPLNAVERDELEEMRSTMDTLRRTVWFGDDGAVNRTNLTDGSTPAVRRMMRSNQDLVAVSTAVYAAVRRRSRAIMRPKPVLVRVNPRTGEESVVEDPNHPAKRLLRRINGSLSFPQAMSHLETQKLTSGFSVWVKRRIGGPGSRVVEFEIWNSRHVKIVPEKERPWIPELFVLELPTKKIEVEPADVVYFRHMLDPRNPLYGLGPIPAARVAIDTGLEATRYNQGFFDNDASPGRVYSMPEGSAAEAERIEQDLARKFQSTDKAHRSMVAWGGLEVVGEAMSQEDMQFMEQMRWGVEEVGRVMEVAPIILGDYSNATALGSEAVSPAMRDFWVVVMDQTDSAFADLTEFLLRPDFDPGLKLVADYSNIPELQEDAKRRAEIDGLKLADGRIVVNEVRQRDGAEPVEWGDEPLIDAKVLPLSLHVAPTAPAPKAEAALALPPGATTATPEETDAQRQSRVGMQRLMTVVFGAELRRMLAWITEAAKNEAALVKGSRQLPPDLWGGYDWDFLAHEAAVGAELDSIYQAALQAAGYSSAAPLTEAQTLAATYARNRGAEMLVLSGDRSIVDWTRTRVRRLTAESILAGDGVRTLKNKLRADFRDWTPRRAETVARTELAFAQGDATQKAYRSNGFEAKEWSWPGGKADGICDVNDGEVVRLDDVFPDGSSAPPAHPNCTCSLLPVEEMPDPK